MLGDLVDVAVLVFVLVLGILWMSLVGEPSKNRLVDATYRMLCFGIEAQV